MAASAEKHHDALVVGIGFAGLYEIYLLKQLGLDVKGIDSAADVGGTWFWNCYPEQEVTLRALSTAILGTRSFYGTLHGRTTICFNQSFRHTSKK